MTQYAQYDNGQQHGMQFGYDPAFFNDNSPFLEFQPYTQTPLLNQNETEDLNSFFQNPPDFSKNAPVPTEDHDPMAGVGMKMEHGDGGAFGDHLAGYHGPNDTISNPAVTLAQSMASNVETARENIQHLHMRNPQPFGYDTSSEDEIAAANLFNISHHGSHGQFAPSINGAPATSWGNMGTNLPIMNGPDHMMHSPMTSSGRQSSVSHGDQSYFNQEPFYNTTSPQEALSHFQFQQQLQNHSRNRGGSLQADPGVMFWQQAGSHVNPNMAPLSAGIHGEGSFHDRQSMRFGSDSSFGRNGYNPPRGHVTQQDEKAANLSNVPFAEHLQAHTPLHTPTFPTAMHQPRIVPHYGINSQQMQKSPASPTNMGGLPHSASSSSAYHHGHPSHPFPGPIARNKSGDAEEDDSESDEIEQPRKRRKSQPEREDDAEYTPDHHHVKTPLAKRSSKATRAKDGSDDDDDDEGYTPVASKSSKRRRSTAVSSSQGTSPSGMPSTSALDSGSRNRRKSRTSQPRLNLTEEEKRQNHIKSEKHRRDLIKNQYECLDELVPGIKTDKSSLSRADVLKEIVNYVESTKSGNEKMVEFLRAHAAGGGGGATSGSGAYG